MSGSDRLYYYLRGKPEDVDGYPRAVEIPRVYESEAEARSELSVVMTLSGMVHGPEIAQATSWYLQTASTSPGPTLTETQAFWGYCIGDSVHPVGGGWEDAEDADDWAPFVCEMEARRAHRARLPWHPRMLEMFDLQCCRGLKIVDFSFFRFTPIAMELLVRPLYLYECEPLF